jgi:nitrogen regulatory protein PII-like uncharacterized protein
MKLATLTIAMGVLAGCAGAAPQSCAPGLTRMVQAQLFFGRDIVGRAMVSEEEWRGFLDEEVAPRFPAGWSVADFNGQYRDSSGRIVHEQSKQLLVVTSGAVADEVKLTAIRGAYKRRFNQESVLLIESPVCAGL